MVRSKAVFRLKDRASALRRFQLTAAEARTAREVVLFFGAAFALTWTILAAYVFAPKAAAAHLGAMKTGSPVFFLAVYAPTLSAIALTLLQNGSRGLVALARSALRVAGSWPWVVMSLVGYPILWLVVAVVEAVLDGKGLSAVAYQDWYALLPSVILSGFIFHDAGPLGEELGWRGYALPRLLSLFGPRQAAVLLGALWAIWHIPAFFLAGLSQSKFQFGDFFFQVISFSIFMTLLFIHTRGSVLLSGIIPHMWFNAVSKAGIHPVGWITIALAAGLLFVGRPLWGKDPRASRPGPDLAPRPR